MVEIRVIQNALKFELIAHKASWRNFVFAILAQKSFSTGTRFITNHLFANSESATKVRPEIIRPDHDSENASPETEVEKSDRVQPRREPQPTSQRVLLNLYLDLLASRSFRACF
jgi:hypothetical protein